MEMKLSEFECADCGATINEGEYVTFVVCDKCFQKNYRERMGLPEEKKNTMENFKKFDLNEPHETTASGSVAAPKEEEKSINNPEWHIKVLKDRIAESEKQYNELESENTALREALKDIIKFCEQFELSETKKETLKEYKKLIEKWKPSSREPVRL